MEYKGKKYEVLEVLKKSKYPEQDLFVCMSEYGYKECFQRFDIEYQFVDARRKVFSWTEEELDYIRQQLERGKTPIQISEGFINPQRTKSAICTICYKVKSEMGI